MEEFKKTSDTESYGEETATTGTQETTPESRRDDEGRYAEQPHPTSESEERGTD